MPSAEEEGKSLSNPDFWNSRYSVSDGSNPTHEWFRSYEALGPFLKKYLPPVEGGKGKGPRILHLGSGDSTVPEDLAIKEGYRDQICVDFSEVVVQMMRGRMQGVEGVRWRWGDVRDLRKRGGDEGEEGDVLEEGGLGDGSGDGEVDVAFDKGTMDAMIWGSPWSPPEEVLENTGRYVREVHRVLKDDGLFLYVTYRQPHFIRPLLLGRGVEWEMEMEVLGEGESSFEYFGWVLRKKNTINE